VRYPRLMLVGATLAAAGAWWLTARLAPALVADVVGWLAFGSVSLLFMRREKWDD
jgi:hypothetical protein